MRTLLTMLIALSLVACKKYDKLGCENSLVLQPGPDFGKDAIIWDSEADIAHGNHPDNLAMAWTFNKNQLQPGAIRTLLEFDLSSIPADAKITKATLNLYNSYNSWNIDGEHSTRNGSNEAQIFKVTSSWLENTVTWNTAPSFDSNGSIYLPQSSSLHQNYEGIDLTDFARDWHNDPSSNHGIMIKLNTEQYYRCLNFASSDNTDPEIRPMLVVDYED